LPVSSRVMRTLPPPVPNWILFSARIAIASESSLDVKKVALLVPVYPTNPRDEPPVDPPKNEMYAPTSEPDWDLRIPIVFE
jgi:hypothetical protein